MTRKQDSPKEESWKAALTSVVKEENFLRPLVEQIFQHILEAEMDETLGRRRASAHPIEPDTGADTTHGR